MSKTVEYERLFDPKKCVPWPISGPDGEELIVHYPQTVIDAAHDLVSNSTWKSLEDEIAYCFRKARLYGKKNYATFFHDFEFFLARHIMFTDMPAVRHIDGVVSYYDLLAYNVDNVVPFEGKS